MTIFINVAHIIITIGISAYFYTWLATFKELSEFSDKDWDETVGEINQSGRKIEQMSASQKNVMKYVNKAVFIIVGCLVWVFMVVTIGKIASSLTEHYIAKWLVYIGMYFLFLRIPFGVINRVVHSIHEFKEFPEKVLFSILMIGF
ncbi:MAG: hypothetical protein R3E32_21055 [Chitinophagales bacterium]